MKVVKTDKGYVSGTTIGEQGKEVTIFRGIPYATPPVGALRWKPPQPAAPWEGVRDCSQFSSISPQVFIPGMSAELPMSEDCLYLNVVTPARRPDERLPVMVWMHGGGYTMGCGNDRIWNNYRLPHYGVVVVTLNHRLGPIGLLAHPELSKESPGGTSGNYMFLDIIASLEWIKNNIAAFGGDPDNVTIFGESGGGVKVSVMMASPLAKGLFHKAICQSGTTTAFFRGRPLEEGENYGKVFFQKLGIDSSTDPLEQARRIPWRRIIEASQEMENARKLTERLVPIWDAVVDGRVLPESPPDLLTSGRFNAVPLITCATLGELTGPGPLIIPVLIKGYIEMLEAVNRAGLKGYACIFDRVPSGWKKDGCVSVHSIELPYVFGDWDDSTGWWKSVFVLAQQSGAKTADPCLEITDRTVSEAMMGLWTSFAADGKPRAQGVPDWPEYSRDADRYLYISDRCEVREGFSKAGEKAYQ